MPGTFKVRRDSSVNNVPTVGYNEGADAQDIILFGACEVTETLATDGNGKVTLTHYPVSVSGATLTDASGVRRGRSFNDDISVVSSNGIQYYAGSVVPTDKTVKIYRDMSRTTVVSSSNVIVTYYKRVPIRINENGELIIEKQEMGIQDVNIATSAVLPIALKSSEIPLTEKEKCCIMYKKEGAIPAGASSTIIDLTYGDISKDKYITNIICYHNGTDNAEADGNVVFWLDNVTSGGTTNPGTMDMLMSPRAKCMTQIDLGPIGYKVPAGCKLRFKVSSVWTGNTIHFTALGWQYAD